MGDGYSKDVKAALITMSQSGAYHTFDYDDIDFSLDAVRNGRSAIASGDRDAVKEALSRSGNFTASKELPMRPYSAHLPKFKQWNSLPLSKRVKGFINGS